VQEGGLGRAGVVKVSAYGSGRGRNGSHAKDENVKIARRLRSETAMNLNRIAQRLKMASVVTLTTLCARDDDRKHAIVWD